MRKALTTSRAHYSTEITFHVVAIQERGGVMEVDDPRLRGEPMRLPLSSAQEALQRRLATYEPKCGNCRHWLVLHQAPIGKCGRVGADSAITTDLSVCSQWEPMD